MKEAACNNMTESVVKTRLKKSMGAKIRIEKNIWVQKVEDPKAYGVIKMNENRIYKNQNILFQYVNQILMK